VPTGDHYRWEPESTYIAQPPFFDHLHPEGAARAANKEGDIVGARVLALLGDSVTTDHISPAGSIPPWSPAGSWLMAHGVAAHEFNSYGARRGHHEVMVRGTFGSVHLRNRLAADREGPWTVHQPSGETMFIYDAAARYGSEGVPLIVVAGREYGSGSSRDWAAKGPRLLGVRAVIAESFERIHRSNLVGMGILPLEFSAGESAASLGLTGREEFAIRGLGETLAPGSRVTVEACGPDGRRSFSVVVRLDGPIELAYHRAGGILPAVLRRIAAEA
jgi:aconitate hydratase